MTSQLAHEESATKVRRSERTISDRLHRELNRLYPPAPQTALEKIAYRFTSGSRPPADPAVTKALQSFIAGYQHFAETATNPTEAFHAYRELYVLTRGKIDQIASGAAAQQYPPRPLPELPSLVAGMTDRTVAENNEAIERDSFTLFERPLPDNAIDSILAQVDSGVKDGVQFANGQQVRVCGEHLMKNHLVAKLAADPFLVGIAQQHLGSQPILAGCIAWTSTAKDMSEEEIARLAYLYHSDKDFFNDVKVFTFLTDLDEPEGGQGYVPGTHYVRPEAFWGIRRHTDEEVDAAFTNPPPRLLGCRRGRMSMVNTQALHKGILARKGRRVLLQFIYSNSLFNIEHDVIPTPAYPELQAFGERFSSRLKFV